MSIEDVYGIMRSDGMHQTLVAGAAIVIRRGGAFIIQMSFLK